MTLYSFIPAIAVIAYVPLFIIVIMSRPWERQHTFFILYLAAAMVWSLSSFLLHGNFLPENNMFLARLMTCSFVWMAVQLYLFSRSFGYGNYVPGVILGYILLAGVILFANLGYVPESVTVSDGINLTMGNWFYLIFVPLAILMADNVVAQIRRISRLTDQVQRARIAYILLGVCIMALFSFSNAFEFLRRLPVDHFGNLAAAGIWTYAIMRYRLLDIRFIARRGLSWIGVIAVAAVGFLFLYSVVNLAAGVPAHNRPAVTALATLSAFVIAVLIYQLRGLFARIVDRLFYRERYDYRQNLIDFARNRISGVTSLKDLGGELLPLLVGSLHCQRAYLMLPETYSSDFTVDFIEPADDAGYFLRIKQDSPISDWLRRENRYLPVENLDIMPEFRGLLLEEREGVRDLGVELFFPLTSRGNLIGILLLGKGRSGRYALEDIRLVENVTGQVAVTMEREFFQEQLKKREQELTLINKLDRVITSSLDIREVYEVFVSELRDVIDVDWASITLIDRDKKEVHFEALSTVIGSAWQVGDNISIKGTADEWVASHRRALIESDLTHESKFSTGVEFVKLDIRSTIYLPLLVKGVVIGCLVLASRKPNAYTSEQVNLLESLSLQIAVSVENSSLYARAEQRARIDELTRLFNRRHFDESLRREIGIQARDGSVLSLVFLDLDLFKEYNDKYGHLDGDKVLSRIGFLIEDAIRDVDLAFRYGGDEFAIILRGAAGDDALLVAERIRYSIDADMQEEQTGITASLGLASWPSDGVTPDDIVTAADRALYYAKRTGGNRTCTVSEMVPSSTGYATAGTKTEKEALSIIYALASTIEARDQYTYGHSRNVSKYAVALAEALGLPSDKVAAIGTAALLHDIGKIGVPDEVLNKPSTLTDEEWEMIRSHPRLSAAIVGHVLSLTPCLTGVLHHQERWDGSGYPSGLSGEAIPIEARILAVADAFEAMTSPRPYRGPLSNEDALREIMLNAGTQFDPKLVDVFLNIAPSMLPERMET